MKTVDDFKKAAKDKNITRWNINDCSICGYKCGFNISGDEVSYDPGCNCVWGGSESRTWQDLADDYNMQTDKKFIKEMNEFWGFK